MRTINYKRKATSASTVYTELSPIDKAFVKQQLTDINLIMDAVIEAGANDKEYQATSDTFTEDRGDLPRRGVYPFKRNSIKDFVDGLIENFEVGNQRDFSEKQLRGIEVVFSVLHDMFPEICENIEFVQGQLSLLPKPKPQPAIVNIPQTGLFDFGDYEVSITVRKKV
jgi:hypothetical protein